MSNHNDAAGTSYWNANWSLADLSKPFSHLNTSLDNYVNLMLHDYFTKIIKEKNLSILEIGCANSIWPIYFSQYHHAKVAGLDYSENGCAMSKKLFEHYNVQGDIYCSDLFKPSSDLLDKFDMVLSFGVVEHFKDTAGCLRACAQYVKPNGYLFTMIPNTPGVIGLLQKWADKKVYDVHIPLTKTDLIKAHAEAGLNLLECDYFMSMNLSVVNSGDFSSHRMNKYFRHALSIPSKICWTLEKHGLKFPSNSFTSPYIIALSQKL